MSTKAERFRYEAERSGTSGKSKKKGSTAAAEAPRSPRKSKHRLKDATPLTAKNLLSKISPHNRHDAGPPNLRAPR